MSGGHFEYSQYQIRNIADEIESVIENNYKEKPLKDRWNADDIYRYAYPDDVISEFKNAVKSLRIAEVYAQRVDWLLSGDDGEETFHERLKEDLSKL